MGTGNVQNRFGSIAIRNGFITEDHLVEAINIQAENKREGRKHKLIGEILRERELMNTSQIGKVLKIMGIIP